MASFSSGNSAAALNVLQSCLASAQSYLSIYLSILEHHTTWQPTFAIPLVPLLSSWRRSVPNPSNPGCYLPIVFYVCLSFSLPLQRPGGLSWQVPKLLWHAHTTSYCVFIRQLCCSTEWSTIMLGLSPVMDVDK